ncbi:hypothetical protein FXF51_07950 [Nonomuraea sp. PA05]|uniref:hypothetical protein n=1 Tax=Nonomuraea sp. PA05 TaxID=2604466 RepID=UPI0011D78C17|nr:hypothetical protein [Nonomuraea sp. PA05]TYB69164.1 hypothetical protein FXF51_07950 [Nonomuraea sp. PA05]
MRTDLLGLTTDSLAALTNRGLVKRAGKEAVPELRTDEDGTVHGDFPGGPATSLPTGGLDVASCTCGAIGVCRHVIAVILAYQRLSPEADADAGTAQEAASGAAKGTATGTEEAASIAVPRGVRGAASGAAPETAQGAPPRAASGAAPGVASGAAPGVASGAAPGVASGAAPGVASGAVRGVASGAAPGTVPGAVPGVASGSAPAAALWSPGQVTDEQLTARIGTRLMAAARRAERAGYTARIRRPTPADPVPQVELATATVRFLIPGDLGFVHTDSVAGSRDDVIALAVWAFRTADELHPDAPDVRVDVGGGAEEGAGSGLERALGLAGTVLREGAAHLGHGLDATIADVQRHLDGAGLRWPLLAVGDLAEQLAAYRDRAAHYRPEQLASHLAELHARHRAVTRPDATLRSSVLGTAEAAETPLRRARLEGLGCRVRGLGGQRFAEVYLAHADNAMVLVLRRRWDGDDDGAVLARRRIATSTLGALATGNLVTESAVRSASRTVRLATGRVAKSTVSPSRGDWGELPAPLVVTDYAALGRELDALPLRPVRPRVEAELVRVLAIAQVEAIWYAPGDQRLDAVITDSAGNPAVVRAVHSTAAPGRLDALAAVLAGEEGEPRFVSGVVGRGVVGGGVSGLGAGGHGAGGRGVGGLGAGGLGAGGLVVEPLGLAAGDRVIVPDLRPAGGGKLDLGADERPEPLAAVLADTRGLLAEAAHHGLAHLPSAFGDRLAAAAQRLSVLGLHRIARAVTAFAAARAHGSEEAAEQAWVDAYLRLEVALDLS